MTLSPLLKQLLVAVSIQAAAISVGGIISYPNVLIHQLNSNDSMIKMDLDTSSWIGSIHGLTGIPTILMPIFMQWQGRKPAFIISCLFVTIGWTLAYIATTVSTILISESFHGLGCNCVLIVSSCCLAEFTDPKYRNIFMTTYFVLQSIGVAGIAIMGQYIHWKTISLMMLTPIILALINIIFVWPESPSWLAVKGRLAECEKNFKWLRGSSKEAIVELTEMLCAKKEMRQKEPLCQRILSRDFYIPTALMFVLLNMFYWSGVLVVMIYFLDIVQEASGDFNAASYGTIAMNVILFFGYVICAVLIRKFDNKPVLILSTLGTILSALFCCIVTYLQSAGVLDKSLLCLYGLIGYIISCTLGLATIPFNMGMELMPVRHRDIGGALFVISTCILHLSSMKAAPYMFLYIDLWRSFIVYATNGIVCILIVWKYVPETKGKTLQELEDYFAFGRIVKCINEGVDKPIIVLAE